MRGTEDADVIRFPTQEDRLRRKAAGLQNIGDVIEECWPTEKEGRLIGYTPWYRPAEALARQTENEEDER